MAGLYTPEIVKEVCRLLSEGIPLEEICRMPSMPDAQTIHDWKSENRRPKNVPESVASDIARAREIGYDAIAARLRKTARGKIEKQGGDSTGDVQRDKLIIETDLKLLAKWTKKYADKTTSEVTGADGEALIPKTIEVVLVRPESADKAS